MSLPVSAVGREGEEVTDPSGLVGRLLVGRYRVTGLLGVGGIGRVYRAVNTAIQRPVALKVLLEHYACIPDVQKRFEREARALGALSHPSIVTITDFVTTRDSITFLVMELIEGESLDDMLERGPIPPGVAFPVMEQILSSLAYAHDKEVVHRDLKPSNVIVRELAGGRPHAVILDFGLAKFMDGSGPNANLTKTGLVVGTPAYMAPEQASGGRADRRTDVYSAGILFYEMLAGVTPFVESEGQELLRSHLLTPPPPLAARCEAEVHPALEQFLSRALAKDGADRYADGRVMLDALLGLPGDAFVPPSQVERQRDLVRSDAPTALGLRSTRPVPMSEVAPEKRRRPWVWMGALGVLGLVAVVAAYFAGAVRDPAPTAASQGHSVLAAADPAPDVEPREEPVAELPGEPVRVAEPPPDPPPAETPVAVAGDVRPDPDRPTARNPWRGGAPRQLERIRRRMRRGRITQRDLRALGRYRRAHPDDAARAWILRARIATARGGYQNALVHYRRAYRADPRARGDPRMRRELVHIAATEGLHQEATDELIRMYGTEAVPNLVTLVESERDEERRSRLSDTLRQLRALP